MSLCALNQAGLPMDRSLRSGRELLWGDTEDPFKLAAKMGLAGELQLGRGAFGRTALSNQLLGQAASQFAQPAPWWAVQLSFEYTLQMPLGNRKQRCHLSRIEVRRPSQTFPFINCQGDFTHYFKASSFGLGFASSRQLDVPEMILVPESAHDTAKRGSVSWDFPECDCAL